MLEIDLIYAHSYEVEELGEFPGAGKFSVPLLYIPQPKARPEHMGLWLKVNPSSGATWIGVFAFGHLPTFSRVISTFNSNCMCVISQGAGYMAKADEPEAWEEIPLLPVVDVRTLPDHRLLLFSDYIRMVAYGSDGLLWRSPQVCWDGLKIASVTGETIEGIGYDPTNSVTHESRFVVDLKTGRSLLPPIW